LGRKFIYLDETGFNNILIPIYGYSKKGEPVSYSGQPKCSNHSVLAALTDEGILGYQIFEKAVRGKDFACFLIN